MGKDKSRSPRWLLFALGALVVVIGAAAVWLFSDSRKPLTWEEAFNRDNGTSVLIDISDGPRHLISFNFDPESDQVEKFTVVVCWGDGDNPKMQEDHEGWARFTDQVRRYSVGTKMEVIGTNETANGKPLKAMQLTGTFYLPRSAEEAQQSARLTSQQLWDYGPCKKD